MSRLFHKRQKRVKQFSKGKTAKGLLWGGLSNSMQQLLNLFSGYSYHEYCLVQIME